MPAVFVVGMVGSMLVHEGAHALAAHNLGYRVEWVVLGGADLTALIEMVLVFDAVSLVGNLLPLGQTDGARTLGGLFEHMRSRRPG